MSLNDMRKALITRATAASPGAALSDATLWLENRRHMSGGIEVSPPTDKLWYRIAWVPSDRPKMAGICKGAMVRHTGYFQITICDGRKGTDQGGLGDVEISAEAQRIMDCFKAGLTLTYGTQALLITGCGRTPGLYDVTGAYAIAVRVYWMADVAN